MCVGRAVRGRQRNNEQVNQDEQLIRIDELNVVKEQLASMYKEIAEGRKESKATLGKIYDAVRVIILLGIGILFVLVVTLVTSA